MMEVVAGAGLVLKLRKTQGENKAGLMDYFDVLFSTCA